MDIDKPRLRVAKVVTELDLLTAVKSCEVEHIHYALIDGSRCLNPDFVLLHAEKLLLHPHARVRWAALFAVEYCRHALIQNLECSDDLELIHALSRIAALDPDDGVRGMAVDTLAALVLELMTQRRRSDRLV